MKYGNINLGQIEAIINKLGGTEGVHKLLSDEMELVPKTHAVNTNLDPFRPDGWEVIEHRKMGQLVWNPEKVKPYLSENQKDGKMIKGHELRKELESQPVLNVCVLDYLLANPHLIPDEWKRKRTYFWGTVYRDTYGYLCVRCLYWHGGRWRWRCSRLVNNWNFSGPSALLASSSRD